MDKKMKRTKSTAQKKKTKSQQREKQDEQAPISSLLLREFEKQQQEKQNKEEDSQGDSSSSTSLKKRQFFTAEQKAILRQACRQGVSGRKEHYDEHEKLLVRLLPLDDKRSNPTTADRIRMFIRNQARTQQPEKTMIKLNTDLLPYETDEQFRSGFSSFYKQETEQWKLAGITDIKQTLPLILSQWYEDLDDEERLYHKKKEQEARLQAKTKLLSQQNHLSFLENADERREMFESVLAYHRAQIRRKNTMESRVHYLLSQCQTLIQGIGIGQIEGFEAVMTMRFLAKDGQVKSAMVPMTGHTMDYIISNPKIHKEFRDFIDIEAQGGISESDPVLVRSNLMKEFRADDANRLSLAWSDPFPLLSLSTSQGSLTSESTDSKDTTDSQMSSSIQIASHNPPSPSRKRKRTEGDDEKNNSADVDLNTLTTEELESKINLMLEQTSSLDAQIREEEDKKTSSYPKSKKSKKSPPRLAKKQTHVRKKNSKKKKKRTSSSDEDDDYRDDDEEEETEDEKEWMSEEDEGSGQGEPEDNEDLLSEQNKRTRFQKNEPLVKQLRKRRNPFLLPGESDSHSNSEHEESDVSQSHEQEEM